MPSQFSEARFYKQAMMIVTELLNVSPATITNEATYLSILDVAVSLEKNVTAEFGVLPNANKRSKKLDDLTEQLILMQQALQVRMMRKAFLPPEIPVKMEFPLTKTSPLNSCFAL